MYFIRLHVLGKVVIRLQSYECTLIFNNHFANNMIYQLLEISINRSKLKYSFNFMLIGKDL